MQLKITHRTQYHYDLPLHYALQRLRLQPLVTPAQKVLDWSIDIEGASRQAEFTDQFGNTTLLVSALPMTTDIAFCASGHVQTRDTNGVIGPHTGFAPLWLYRRDTALTRPGKLLREMARKTTSAGSNELERLHALMDMVLDAVSYRAGTTEATTPAEEALEKGSGVCQDHAHVFLTVARLNGFACRYVSGYLMHTADEDAAPGRQSDRDDDKAAGQSQAQHQGNGASQDQKQSSADNGSHAATHAWAEAHVNGLGWVGFDPANRICPDERYVRLATGLDYADAAPVSGIRLSETHLGISSENLAVSVTVEQ